MLTSEGAKAGSDEYVALLAAGAALVENDMYPVSEPPVNIQSRSFGLMVIFIWSGIMSNRRYSTCLALELEQGCELGARFISIFLVFLRLCLLLDWKPA